MARTKTSARQSLLDAATILLAENPGASFIEIAEAAGVGRASLYRHFPTREDLIRELSLEAIRATDKASSHIMSDAASATDALRLSVEAMIPLGDRYYFLTRLPVMEDEEVNRHIKRQNSEMLMLIKAVQQEGSIDPKLPANWAVAVFNGLIYTAWQVMAEEGLSTEDAASLVFRTLLNGLGAQQSDE